jgi:hypothetical protein
VAIKNMNLDAVGVLVKEGADLWLEAIGRPGTNAFYMAMFSIPYSPGPFQSHPLYDALIL